MPVSGTRRADIWTPHPRRGLVWFLVRARDFVPDPDDGDAYDGLEPWLHIYGWRIHGDFSFFPFSLYVLGLLLVAIIFHPSVFYVVVMFCQILFLVFFGRIVVVLSRIYFFR